MAHAEFEEREFETPLYHQLRVANNHIWSPGQVLEHHVGFDYSALCVDSYFWAIHGLREPFDGFLFEELFRRRIWRRREFGRSLPNFALNLFLQAKRPEIRARLTKALKGRALNSPYWRISLDENQQRVLEGLSNATAGRCLVCYATAAFDRLTQLYAHITQGTIVAHSSFPQASWLSGHDAWNYDRPGAVGVANPEPRQIEGPALGAQIETLLAEQSNASESNYDENLKALAANISRVAEENAGVGRGALFFQRVAEIESLVGALELPRYSEPIKYFLKVLAFTATYQLQWYVLGGKRYG